MPLLRLYAGIIALALASPATAAARSFVIQGDTNIGGYAVKADGTLDGAIEEFGEPTSLRGTSYQGQPRIACVARWPHLGLRISFYNLGGQDACEPQYGNFSEALITGKRWRTSKGLRIGDSARRLRSLYGRPRFTGQWAWLLTRYSPYGGGAYYPGLEAKLLRDRVTAFRINYAAGGD
jgi:hypothetical protein